jgi:hypothetical protein
MKPDYAPNKDIGSALRAILDYKDDKKIMGKTGLERAYDGWQRLLVVLKSWTHADAQSLLDYIKEAEVDPESFLDYQDPFKVGEPDKKFLVSQICIATQSKSVQEEGYNTHNVTVNTGVDQIIRVVTAKSKPEAIGKFILATAAIQVKQKLDPICIEISNIKQIKE